MSKWVISNSCFSTFSISNSCWIPQRPSFILLVVFTSRSARLIHHAGSSKSFKTSSFSSLSFPVPKFLSKFESRQDRHGEDGGVKQSHSQVKKTMKTTKLYYQKHVPCRRITISPSRVVTFGFGTLDINCVILCTRNSKQFQITSIFGLGGLRVLTTGTQTLTMSCSSLVG